MKRQNNDNVHLSRRVPSLRESNFIWWTRLWITLSTLSLISFPDLLWTKPKARSGQIQFAPRDHLSEMWQGRPVRMPNNDKFPKRSRSSKGRFTRYDSVANNKLTTSLWHDLGIFARISKFRRFHETKQINPKWGRKVFSTTWPDLFSKTFATVGVF